MSITSITAQSLLPATYRPAAIDFSKHEKNRRLSATELHLFLKDIVQYYKSKGIAIQNSDFLNGGVLSMHQLFQRIDTRTPSADKERLRHEYTQFRCVREGTSHDVMRLGSGPMQWLQIDPKQSIEHQKQSTYLIPRQNGASTTGAVIYKSLGMYRIYDPGNNKHEPYTHVGKTIHKLDLKTLDQAYRSDSSKRHPVQPPKSGRPLPMPPVQTRTVVPPATLGLPGYGGWDDAGRQSCTRKLQEYFSKNRGTGIDQLTPTSPLPYQADLKSLQQSVQVHISPGSGMTPNNVGTWLSQKQYYNPRLTPEIKENAMDVVLTGSMKQLYDYDTNTPVGSRDLTKNPRDIEFMYNTMPNFQHSGAHYKQVFDAASGHLKDGYEATMKTLFKRSFTTMLHACKAHYEKTKGRGFTSFEFPVQMPNAFFSGFDRVPGGRDEAKQFFSEALQEFLVDTTLPEGCSGVTTIGFGTFSSLINHANVRHSTANSLHYYDAAKKANVQCLVPIMGDEHSRMMNGAFGNGAKQAAEENISRQTLGQPAMLLCPVNNPNLAANLNLTTRAQMTPLDACIHQCTHGPEFKALKNHISQRNFGNLNQFMSRTGFDWWVFPWNHPSRGQGTKYQLRGTDFNDFFQTFVLQNTDVYLGLASMIDQQPRLLLTHGGEARCAKIYNFYEKCQDLAQTDAHQKTQWDHAFRQIKRAATTIGFRFRT